MKNKILYHLLVYTNCLRPKGSKKVTTKIRIIETLYNYIPKFLVSTKSYLVRVMFALIIEEGKSREIFIIIQTISFFCEKKVNCPKIKELNANCYFLNIFWTISFIFTEYFCVIFMCRIIFQKNCVQLLLNYFKL